jgi:hypothetical protein
VQIVVFFGDKGRWMIGISKPRGKKLFPQCIQPQDTAAQQNNVAQVVNGESFRLKDFLEGRKVNDQQLANDTATNGKDKGGIRKDIQLVKAFTRRTADVGIHQVAIDKRHECHGRVTTSDFSVI